MTTESSPVQPADTDLTPVKPAPEVTPEQVLHPDPGEPKPVHDQPHDDADPAD